jgi:PAS domain-containing protein
VPSDQPGEARAPGPIPSEPGSLLESVPVAVLGLDAAGRVRYWGPGAQELFGHPAATALSRPAAALFPPQGDGPGPAERLVERALALGYWRCRLCTATAPSSTAGSASSP